MLLTLEEISKYLVETYPVINASMGGLAKGLSVADHWWLISVA